jgi:hypothetical protein
MAGVLFVCASADRVMRERFDDWYDRVHLPDRMRVPGFQYAVRLREIGEDAMRGTACLYVLSSATVLYSRAYLSLQAQTAKDTASHAAEVHLDRPASDVVEGELPSTRQWAQSGQLLLAAVTPAEPHRGRGWKGDVRVRWSASYDLPRRYEGCELTLSPTGSAAEAPRRPADAVAGWVLEATV